MTKREKLQEQYEDALFSLLMDEFMVSEGKKALEENERLKSDPNFVVPPDLEKRCLRTISRYCAKKSLNHTGRTISKVLSKVAVVALIGALCFTTAFAAIDEFRVNTLNWIIDVFDDRTVFTFTPQVSEDSLELNESIISVNWLPYGYALIDEDENNFYFMQEYESSDGDRIYIELYLGENISLGMDTEDADVQTIEIQDNDAMLITKGDDSTVSWVLESQKIFVTISGSKEHAKELIRIAENISINNPS